MCGGYYSFNIYRTTTVAPTPAPIPRPRLYPESIGCYTDEKKERVMTNMLTSDAMTPLVCADHCSNYSYFGTQYGTEVGDLSLLQSAIIIVANPLETCDYTVLEVAQVVVGERMLYKCVEGSCAFCTACNTPGSTFLETTWASPCRDRTPYPNPNTHSNPDLNYIGVFKF